MPEGSSGESGDRTEAPTEKKREDSRKDGQVVFSREVSSVAVLAATFVLFYFAGNQFISGLTKSMITAFTSLNTGGFNSKLVMKLMGTVSKSILPFSLTAIALFMSVSFFSNILQVGFRLTGKPLQPKLEKISLIAGAKRLFSKQSFFELLKGLAKIILIGYIGYGVISQSIVKIMNYSSLSVKELLSHSDDLIRLFFFRILVVFSILAFTDYLFQRWDFEQKLKMTKQEIKDEYKQLEGDPKIKSKIRKIQQEMSQARMMQDVPKADVLITNPTHFAVAMRYDSSVMQAPQLVAKGVDHIAFRMIDIAKANDVTVYESPEISRGIYFQVELGDEIPEEFYKAVAEILGFVYRLKNKKKSTVS